MREAAAALPASPSSSSLLFAPATTHSATGSTTIHFAEGGSETSEAGSVHLCSEDWGNVVQMHPEVGSAASSCTGAHCWPHVDRPLSLTKGGIR